MYEKDRFQQIHIVSLVEQLVEAVGNIPLIFFASSEPNSTGFSRILLSLQQGHTDISNPVCLCSEECGASKTFASLSWTKITRDGFALFAESWVARSSYKPLKMDVIQRLQRLDAWRVLLSQPFPFRREDLRDAERSTPPQDPFSPLVGKSISIVCSLTESTTAVRVCSLLSYDPQTSYFTVSWSDGPKADSPELIHLSLEKERKRAPKKEGEWTIKQDLKRKRTTSKNGGSPKQRKKRATRTVSVAPSVLSVSPDDSPHSTTVSPQTSNGEPQTINDSLPSSRRVELLFNTHWYCGLIVGSTPRPDRFKILFDDGENSIRQLRDGEPDWRPCPHEEGSCPHAWCHRSKMDQSSEQD